MSATTASLCEPRAGRGWPWTLRVVAVAALLGAEVIHVAAMNAHFDEWVWAGVFFLVVSVAEGLLAAGLLVAPSRRLAKAAVAISLLTALVWFRSRTAGLPVGPEAGGREAVGRADTISTVFELVTAAFLLWSLRLSRGGPSVPDRARRARGAAVAAVVAITALTALAVRYPGAAAHHLLAGP